VLQRAAYWMDTPACTFDSVEEQVGVEREHWMIGKDHLLRES
jgi:hypothetical protein